MIQASARSLLSKIKNNYISREVSGVKCPGPGKPISVAGFGGEALVQLNG